MEERERGGGVMLNSEDFTTGTSLERSTLTHKDLMWPKVVKGRPTAGSVAEWSKALD